MVDLLQAQIIRELILLAEIFEPGRVNVGWGPGLMMKRIPGLLDYEQQDVRAALLQMEVEGLVEGSDDRAPPSHWRSTPSGRAVREKMERDKLHRAQCLCHSTVHNIDDLVLALVASSEVCELGHVHPCNETSLADYLFDYREDLTASIHRLMDSKLVSTSRIPTGPGRGRTLHVTVAGLQQYRRIVEERLCIPDGFCVLDAQPPEIAIPGTLGGCGLDESLIKNLATRMKEAENCELVQASLAATVLYGSVLEGLLEGLAKANPKIANSASATPRRENGKPKDFAEWKFVEWIAVGREVGWIPKSVGGYVDQLRSYRNLVHVAKQLRDEIEADRHLVAVTRSVLDAVLLHTSEIMQGASR